MAASGPPAVCDYREGAWVHDPTAQAPYRLQREFAGRDTALKADETRLAELKKAQERDAAAGKAETDAHKREIDALERSIKRTRDELRVELKTRSDAELDKSWQEINNAVVEYAREQGLDLVVPSPVVYADPRIDITDRVLINKCII